MKNDINDPENKEKLLVRLRRIEGQVRGIQSMVDDERYCKDILQQLSAVRAAIQGVTQEYLKQYAVECLLNLDDQDKKEREILAEELVNILGKNC